MFFSPGGKKLQTQVASIAPCRAVPAQAGSTTGILRGAIASGYCSMNWIMSSTIRSSRASSSGEYFFFSCSTLSAMKG